MDVIKEVLLVSVMIQEGIARGRTKFNKSL